MTTVHGVLLDIDDTLVDTKAAFADGLRAVASAYLPTLAPLDHEAMLAMWRADAGGHYRAYTRGHVTQAEQRLARANELHTHFGAAPLTSATFPAWDAVYWAGFRASWRAHDDALDAVANLREAGLAVGALTNATAAVSQEKLTRVGLGDLVPLLVSLDTFGVGKPDPRVFHEAARLLGTGPSATVYVGDELDTDAMAAARAGLRGIWLDRPGNRRGGVHLEGTDAARTAGIAVVHSLAEIPPMLEPAPCSRETAGRAGA